MTEAEARQKANELCAVMGEGWKPKVYHNYEWYYGAVKNLAEVCPNRSGTSFTVLLELRKQFEYKSRNPLLAYKKVMRDAQEFATEL
jgi:hypothetical protein